MSSVEHKPRKRFHSNKKFSLVSRKKHRKDKFRVKHEEYGLCDSDDSDNPDRPSSPESISDGSSRPPSPPSPLSSSPPSPPSPPSRVSPEGAPGPVRTSIPGIGARAAVPSPGLCLGTRNVESDKNLVSDVEWQEEIDRLQPPVSRAHQEKRLAALAKLHQALVQWSMAFRKANGLEYMTDGNVFCLKVAGSFRFGVYTESSDIDVLLIGSIYIEPAVFFGPLSQTLAAHPAMTSVLNIPKTRVPIIALEVDGIPIDLLLASTSMGVLPDPFNPLDSALMASTDLKTLQSLNSARVTEYVLAKATSPTFVPLLKLVRLWAKARGIFGAKHGYLGGVQWCLCVLSLLEMTDASSLGSAVFSFFNFLTTINWEKDVVRLKALPRDVDTRNWYTDGRKYDEAMVVLTPTQPYTNTTFNVNPNSMVHLAEEFERALDLVKAGKVEELFQPALQTAKDVKTMAKRGYKAYLHAHFQLQDGIPEEFQEDAMAEYNTEKGRIDSKMRMLGLSIFKTHKKISDECRLLVKGLETSKEPTAIHWIFGIRLIQQKSNQRIDIKMLLDGFRSDMKLHKLRYTLLRFDPLTPKAFQTWLKETYF